MTPTPTPAPPMPMQAMPAPMYLAAIGSIICSFWLSLYPAGPSVARMNGVVEIDASQDGEHVGLQEGDQRLQRHQHDDHREWEDDAANPADHAHGGAQQDDKVAEDLERDVAGQHVGEQTHAVRDRA